MDRELLKGVIEIFMLGLILKKDTYGYELARNLKLITSNKYNIAEGTLYPALQRLEKKNNIESYIKVNNKYKRKYYRITNKGKEELKLKIKELEEIISIISYFNEVDKP